MKRLVALIALTVSIGIVAPAQSADTGNWISYLKLDGCSCTYGGFSSSATKFTVDGPQASVGSSKSPITISTGNQTQSVKVSFSSNGIPIGATSTDSGQQDGVYFTSSPINLQPGSNMITVTVSDPAGILKPTTVTVTVPYRPVLLTNSGVPTVTGANGAALQAGQAPQCSPGAWTADPAPTLTVTWQGSPDGQAWSQLSSASVASSPYYKYVRCQVVANNGYTTSTAYSASVAMPSVPVSTTPTVVTTTSTPGQSTVTIAPPSATSPVAAAVSSATSTSTTKTATVTPTITSVKPVVTLKTQTKTPTPVKAIPKMLHVDKPIKPIVVHRYYGLR